MRALIGDAQRPAERFEVIERIAAKQRKKGETHHSRPI
jgi:hypothetical protein